MFTYDSYRTLESVRLWMRSTCLSTLILTTACVWCFVSGSRSEQIFGVTALVISVVLTIWAFVNYSQITYRREAAGMLGVQLTALEIQRQIFRKEMFKSRLDERTQWLSGIHDSSTATYQHLYMRVHRSMQDGNAKIVASIVAEHQPPVHISA